MAAMRSMMARLRLTVNETKTRVCRVPDETFDFLGYTIGWIYSPQTGGRYLGVRPSAKKVRGLCAELRRTDGSAVAGAGAQRRWWAVSTAQLRGWASYFCLGTVTKAYRQVTAYTCDRLRQWLGGSTRCRGRKRARFSDRYLHERLGLLQLRRRLARLPAWANA